MTQGICPKNRHRAFLMGSVQFIKKALNSRNPKLAGMGFLDRGQRVPFPTGYICRGSGSSPSEAPVEDPTAQSFWGILSVWKQRMNV